MAESEKVRIILVTGVSSRSRGLPPRLGVEIAYRA
jgi:hypothetical protein